MPSHRYIAAHLAMPRFLRESGASAVLDAVERKDADFFIPVWMSAGFRFTPTMNYTQRRDYRVGLISLPAPREDTEAYLAAIVGKTSDAAYLRYFLWEASAPIMSGQPGTMVGEWSETAHLNHGSGPPFSGNPQKDSAAFVERALKICG